MPGDAPWYDYKDKIVSVEIASGITSISECAFEDCRNMTGVTIPKSVTEIKRNAFYHCDPETVTFGGNETRWYCGISLAEGNYSLYDADSYFFDDQDDFTYPGASITCDLNGGEWASGAEPQLPTYQGSELRFTVPEIPVRSGCTFLGWQINGYGYNGRGGFIGLIGDYDPSESGKEIVIPAGQLLKSVRLYAIWGDSNTLVRSAEIETYYIDGGSESYGGIINDTEISFYIRSTDSEADAECFLRLEPVEPGKYENGVREFDYNPYEMTLAELLKGVKATVTSSDRTQTAEYTLRVVVAPENAAFISIYRPYGGTVTADKAFTLPGETVTLTVTPEPGFVLTYLSYHGRGFDETLADTPSHQTSFSFTLPDDPEAMSDWLEVDATFRSGTEYAITYDLAGGSFAGAPRRSSYLDAEEHFELPIPVRDGFTFVGWRVSGASLKEEFTVRAEEYYQLSGTEIVCEYWRGMYRQELTGDVTLTALWIGNTDTAVKSAYFGGEIWTLEEEGRFNSEPWIDGNTIYCPIPAGREFVYRWLSLCGDEGYYLSYQYADEDTGFADGATLTVYSPDRSATAEYTVRTVAAHSILPGTGLKLNGVNVDDRNTFVEEIRSRRDGSWEYYYYALEQAPVTVTVSPVAADGVLKPITGVRYTVEGGQPADAAANADGSYSFAMPAGNVTLSAVYSEVAAVEPPKADVTELPQDAGDAAKEFAQAITDNGGVQIISEGSDSTPNGISSAALDQLADAQTVSNLTQEAEQAIAGKLDAGDSIKEIKLVSKPSVSVEIVDSESSENVLTFRASAFNGVVAVASTEKGAQIEESVGEKEKLKVNEPVSMLIPLPAGKYPDGTIYIRHLKDDGRVYFYRGWVENNILSFTSEHGLSEFEITDEAPADLLSGYSIDVKEGSYTAGGAKYAFDVELNGPYYGGTVVAAAYDANGMQLAVQAASMSRTVSFQLDTAGKAAKITVIWMDSSCTPLCTAQTQNLNAA